MVLRAIIIIVFMSPVTLYSQKNITNNDIKLLLFSPPIKNLKYNSEFGMRTHPITGITTMHSGIDIAARFEPIYSVATCRVIEVKEDLTSGKYITTKDLISNYIYSYAHLSLIEVEVGEIVKKGKRIGISGNSGRSTGPHLHFSIKSPGGDPIDPRLFLDIFNY